MAKDIPNRLGPKRPEVEYQRVVGRPLAVAKLARIWRQLPERDRLPFVLALDEPIADRLIAAVYEQEKGTNHAERTES